MSSLELIQLGSAAVADGELQDVSRSEVDFAVFGVAETHGSLDEGMKHRLQSFSSCDRLQDVDQRALMFPQVLVLADNVLDFDCLAFAHGSDSTT